MHFTIYDTKCIQTNYFLPFFIPMFIAFICNDSIWIYGYPF